MFTMLATQSPHSVEAAQAFSPLFLGKILGIRHIQDTPPGREGIGNMADFTESVQFYKEMVTYFKVASCQFISLTGRVSNEQDSEV